MLHEDDNSKVCEMYADPHFISFDGAKYDSHHLGTFIYAISDDENFEVQHRILNDFTGSLHLLRIDITCCM